jgi:hypothetical protein
MLMDGKEQGINPVQQEKFGYPLRIICLIHSFNNGRFKICSRYFDLMGKLNSKTAQNSKQFACKLDAIYLMYESDYIYFKKRLILNQNFI